MNKNKFIILTGAANSGKSILAQNMAETLYRDGFNVHFLRSPARGILMGPKPLKDLREKPRVYLRLQEKIFEAQLDQLYEASKRNYDEPAVFIFDRFILDTFMYVNLYCKPKGLFKRALLEKKLNLMRRIFNNAVFIADELQPLFIHCAPIPITQYGPFRPSNIKQKAEDAELMLQLYELAHSCDANKLHMISANTTNKVSLEAVKEKIYSYLNS